LARGVSESNSQRIDVFPFEDTQLAIEHSDWVHTTGQQCTCSHEHNFCVAIPHSHLDATSVSLTLKVADNRQSRFKKWQQVTPRPVIPYARAVMKVHAQVRCQHSTAGAGSMIPHPCALGGLGLNMVGTVLLRFCGGFRTAIARFGSSGRTVADIEN
jgi:hypothetical protein